MLHTTSWTKVLGAADSASVLSWVALAMPVFLPFEVQRPSITPLLPNAISKFSLVIPF